MKNKFGKTDFRNGDHCTLRDGEEMYYKDRMFLGSAWVSVEGYDSNLKRVKSLIGGKDTLSDYDIMRVTRGNKIVFEREEPKDRYFFFCLSYFTQNTWGKLNVSVKSDELPSFKEMEQSALDRIAKQLDVPESSITVIVDNWIEMNEKDFNSWVHCD